jgi:hypothetical protein
MFGKETIAKIYFDRKIYYTINPERALCAKSNTKIILEEIDRLSKIHKDLPYIIKRYLFADITLKKAVKPTSLRYKKACKLKNKGMHLLEKRLKRRKDFTVIQRFIF